MEIKQKAHVADCVETPIKRVVLSESSEGCEEVSWLLLIESLKKMEAVQPKTISPEPTIKLERIDRKTLTPATRIVFSIENEFGRLDVSYKPGQEAVSTLATNFAKMVGTPFEITTCAETGLTVLLQKLPVNLADALEGLFRETIFETMETLVGRFFGGSLDRKKGRNGIAEWHAKACKKRLGAHQGRPVENEELLHLIKIAAVEVRGKITQQTLAEAMRVSKETLRERLRRHSLGWPAVKDFVERTRQKVRG